MKVYYKGYLIPSEESNDTFKMTKISDNLYTSADSRSKVKLDEKDFFYYQEHISEWYRVYSGISDEKPGTGIYFLHQTAA